MYPPGYGGMPPGYAQPGYGYPGQPMQGMYAPPPPGMMGYTMGAAQGQPGAAAAGASLFGMNAMNTALQAPGMALSALGVATLAAPILRYGGGALPGPLGVGARAVGTVLDEIDPFSLGMRAMGAGGRVGGGIGRAIGGALFRGGTGTVARMGMAGLAGAGTIGGAAAFVGAPLAAAYGGYQAARFAGNQLMTGARQSVQAQTMLNQISVPGMAKENMGSGMADSMRQMSQDLGVSFEDVGRYAQQLDQQRVFQTAKDAKEFQTKFKSVMKAVKDIAKMTQSTVDDAMAMFSDLRQQGFYTTADIKAQAASTQAREMATGISAQTYSAIGRAGSQTARALGMRGRFGADLAQRSVAGVAMGVRSGAMNEEMVMEMGGTEAVGMRLAQQQMQFLGTSRGRAIIAATMGQGGAPDMNRLGKFLSGGMTMESLVSTAAGRGLGVLQQAGTSAAKEEFMPYASMAMVQMAAAQQKQLYGRTDRAGTIRMLGTMGVGGGEAQLMYQQAMGMGDQMQQELAAKATARTRAEVAAARQQRSVTGNLRRGFQGAVTDPLQQTGGRIQETLGMMYTDVMQGLGFQDREYSTGGELTRSAIMAMSSDFDLGDSAEARELAIRQAGRDRASGTAAVGALNFVLNPGASVAAPLVGGVTGGAFSGTAAGVRRGINAGIRSATGVTQAEGMRILAGKGRRRSALSDLSGADLGEAERGAQFGRQLRLTEEKSASVALAASRGLLKTPSKFQVALANIRGGSAVRKLGLEQAVQVYGAAGIESMTGKTVEELEQLPIGEQTAIIEGAEAARQGAGLGGSGLSGIGAGGGYTFAERTEMEGKALEQTFRDIYGGPQVDKGKIAGLVGGTVAAGAVAGGTIGIVGGPAGVVVGGAIGAGVAGLLGGAAGLATFAIESGLQEGEQGDFEKKLRANPEVGFLFEQLVQMEDDPDATDADKKALQDKLVKELGADSAGARFALGALGKMSSDTTGKTKRALLEATKKNGALYTQTRRAAYTKATEGKTRRINEKIFAVTKMQGLEKSTQLRLQKFKREFQADPSDLMGQRSAVADLLSGFSGGGLDAGEKEALTALLGTEGLQAADLMVKARAGKLSKEEAEQLGLSNADIAGLKTGDEGAIRAVSEKLAGFALTAPGGTKAKEGSPQAYAEANTKFVQAVHTFLSAVGNAGIEGIDPFPGPGETGAGEMGVDGYPESERE